MPSNPASSTPRAAPPATAAAIATALLGASVLLALSPPSTPIHRPKEQEIRPTVSSTFMFSVP